MSETIFQYFLVVPLGLESLAKKELLLKFPNIIIEFNIIEGGVEFSSGLKNAENFCRFLKVPTRILLRIESFKVKDAPSFYNKALKIKWNQYLRGTIPKLHISSIESRLFDSRKIENAMIGALKDYFKINPTKEKYQQDPGDAQVFIRIKDDNAIISIALDGERLNKRGHKQLINKAPIRENLAAALLFYSKQKFPNITTLIDPMSGSGTFALESLTFNQSIKRELYINKLPLFLKTPEQKKMMIEDQLYSFVKIFDKDEQALHFCKENLKSQNISSDHYEIKLLDVFNNEQFIDEKAGLIINPPYGKRFKIEGEPEDYYRKLLKKLIGKFNPKFIGIITPNLVKLKEDNFKIKDQITFSNGGIKVTFSILEVL